MISLIFLDHLKRNEFNDRTVLTIAHRLNTIIDYDRVLTMGNGALFEDGSSLKLINEHESHFYKMAKESKDFNSLIKSN